jgi:hypothetical protein
MGLDQYLNKKLYVSEFETGGPEMVDNVYKFLGITDESGNYKHAEIMVPAIYWRKSNQIHKWFVDNVQEGEDDCKEYNVGIDELKNLLGVVKEQLKNKKKIILEPQSGFFFGRTEIDEYYWRDLERTKKELEREIKFHEDELKNRNRNWDFYYTSSW